MLYGGCITLLAASLGTPYAPQTEGKLLFIEDRDVKPYQLDRLLRQMMLAGKFEGVTGIIFGEMLDCVAPGQEAGMLDEVILRVFDWFRWADRDRSALRPCVTAQCDARLWHSKRNCIWSGRRAEFSGAGD